MARRGLLRRLLSSARGNAAATASRHHRYPASMLRLSEMRRLRPLPVFIVLLILFVLMLGFACVCISDHPSQAAERALGAIAHAPAVIEISALLPLSMLLFVTVAAAPVAARGRASPAQLQRFLF